MAEKKQATATETTVQPTPQWDGQYDEGGGDYADIPEGTYCFELTNVSKFKHDVNGTLRAEFEMTIKGETDDGGGLIQSEYDGRKVWENGGALEGIQIEYFVAKLLRAFRERNPDKAVYIDAVPFLPDTGKLIDIVVPEGGESAWEEYLTPFVELDFMCSLRVNEKETEKGYGTKYYKNFPKDQSAGLSEGTVNVSPIEERTLPPEKENLPF